jgi:hypothetical protein
MKQNTERGALFEGALLGLVVILGAAAIVLYGAGRQPEAGAPAGGAAAIQSTAAPTPAATPGPSRSFVATQEAAMPDQRRNVPPDPEIGPTYGPDDMPAALRPAIAQATAHLAQRLGVGHDQIELVGVQRLFKPGRNNDAPGVPIGWSLRFDVAGDRYAYTVDARGTVRPR